MQIEVEQGSIPLDPANTAVLRHMTQLAEQTVIDYSMQTQLLMALALNHTIQLYGVQQDEPLLSEPEPKSNAKPEQQSDLSDLARVSALFVEIAARSPINNYIKRAINSMSTTYVIGEEIKLMTIVKQRLMLNLEAKLKLRGNGKKALTKLGLTAEKIDREIKEIEEKIEFIDKNEAKLNQLLQASAALSVQHTQQWQVINTNAVNNMHQAIVDNLPKGVNLSPQFEDGLKNIVQARVSIPVIRNVVQNSQKAAGNLMADLSESSMKNRQVQGMQIKSAGLLLDEMNNSKPGDEWAKAIEQAGGKIKLMLSIIEGKTEKKPSCTDGMSNFVDTCEDTDKAQAKQHEPLQAHMDQLLSQTKSVSFPKPSAPPAEDEQLDQGPPPPSP